MPHNHKPDYICIFCSECTNNYMKLYKPKYYKDNTLTVIPYCNLGCVKKVLVNAQNQPDDALEMAIFIIEKLKADPEKERAMKYRDKLIRKAHKCANLI